MNRASNSVHQRALEVHRAFEYAMRMEAHYRACEYQVADHAEKAKMHRMRWYWMDKATVLLSQEATNTTAIPVAPVRGVS